MSKSVYGSRNADFIISHSAYNKSR